MLKRMGVFCCACVLVSAPAMAGPIVTWQADGSVTRQVSDILVPPEPGTPESPAVGTPLSLTFSFDPTSAMPSLTGVPGGVAGCEMVSVSGSVNVGGFLSTAAPGSTGFTNAGLPGTNCNSSGNTQFTFYTPAAPPGGSFALPAGMWILSYRDLLVQDAFPLVPTPSSLADVTFLASGGGQFRTVFQGDATLTAVDQSTPVPEPATLTLLGLGLAAAARARRARQA